MLKCGCLNVGGLKKRLNIPDFVEYVQTFDIFCVSETHADYSDLLDIDGYFFFSHPRTQPYKRKSGGIGIYVRSNFASGFKVLPCSTEYVLWLSIDKSVTNFTNNIALGALYLPPENSHFFTSDEFELFYNSCVQICSEFQCVFLAGDCNARTSNLDDFIPLDPFIRSFINIDAQDQAHFDKYHILESLSIPLQRKTEDARVNTHGYKLLDLCKNSNLFILNGRLGNDSGRFTFRDISVIDYVLASAECFHCISDFRVIENDPIHSDGHHTLHWNINIPARAPRADSNNSTNKSSVRWRSGSDEAFCLNINKVNLNEILEQLQTNPHSQQTIETITDQLSNLFQEAASKTFPDSNVRTRNPLNKNSWFGPQCKQARRSYHKARSTYKRYPNANTKSRLNAASKQYKTTINYYNSKFKHRNAQKLRSMQKEQPKKYWRFLNNLKPRSLKPDAPSQSDFYNHFKELNSNPENVADDNFFFPDDTLDSNAALNAEITSEEILKCINSLKNSKSPSPEDKILNEFLKCAKILLMPVFVKLFNAVLNYGILPSSWLNGFIIPIFKNKGDSKHPSNYRPITILSCLGKLFTSVINNRLTTFLHSNIIHSNQAGFRSGYSCSDHIFTLHSLIDILRKQRKKLYCAFIDFSSAFDKVNRINLWEKLLTNFVDGKLFRVIYNMYSNIKSCVWFNGEFTEYFSSEIGLRQGESLSPVLFSLFLNDMQASLESYGGIGVELKNIPDASLWLKLLILLYADDTVIVSSCPDDFQKCLDAFSQYCNLWHLKVNLNKTKIVVFGARNTNRLTFLLGDHRLEIVDKYQYLGVVFSSSGSFLQTRKHIVQQAKKAMHLLLIKVNNSDLPIDLTLKLFDHTVLPILTYGSEVFGFENLDMIESVHSDFLRKITRARKSTPMYILYGELGRYPISVTIKSKMVSFWTRLLKGDKNKLSYKIYTYMLSVENSDFKWITEIKKTLNTVGKTYIWNEQANNARISPNLHKMVKQTLIDQFIQNWDSQLLLSNKGAVYKSFKTTFGLEPYFKILPQKFCLTFFKFRSANHKFPIETGRWDGTILNDRKCTLCNNGTLGSEEHYLLQCTYFTQLRQTYLGDYVHISNTSISICFARLLTCTSRSFLINICNFLYKIMRHFETRR